MKKIVLFSFILGLNLSAWAQTAATFSLRDTAFAVGSICRPQGLRFDIEKATIRPESRPFLDSLATLLLRKPNLRLEIGGHRDDCDAPPYSNQLEKKRAQTVEAYLVHKGVPASQVLAVGYGCQKPIYTKAYINKLQSPAAKSKARQANRRTELKILATD